MLIYADAWDVSPRVLNLKKDISVSLIGRVVTGGNGHLKIGEQTLRGMQLALQAAGWGGCA